MNVGDFITHFVFIFRGIPNSSYIHFPFYSIVCWRIKQRIVKFAYKTKGLLHDVYLILALWVPATMCSAWSTPWDKGRGGEGREGHPWIRHWCAYSVPFLLFFFLFFSFLFFSFSSFDRFSYFRTLIIIMIIIINITSFHTVSFLRDRADHFKVEGLKNLAVFRHLSCICSPSYLPPQQI